MSFLAPMAFFFAALLPVVVVFYLLKRKRVVKLVSSTLLWQRFLAETQASAPFQRLRHNWLLILQLLLLALVIFALSRPYLPGESKQSRLRILILDGSASMRSTDVPPNRFEQARDEALKLVDSLATHDQMAVFLATASTEVKQSATSDKVVLRRAIQQAQPADSPTRLIEAFKLAETLTRDRSDAEIHLFSDGAIPNLDELQNKNLPVVYHRIGNGSFNLGIVSLDVRVNPENAGQRAVFAKLANFSTNAESTEVELRFNDTIVEVRPVTIPGTNFAPLVFLAPQTNDGVFSLRSTRADMLPADNRAALVSLMPRPAKALLMSAGNRFLEKALRGAGNIELDVTTSVNASSKDYDVVILDNLVPVTWPDANTLAIHTANTNWFPNWEALKLPPIVDWKNNHPLLRFVSFDNVDIRETLRVPKPDWGLAIVDSPQTPLIVAGEVNRRRLVWIGFDVLESTWPLRVSFPIFIANTLEWLNPANVNANQLMVRAGDPFRMALDENVRAGTVRRPDGTKDRFELDPNARELVYGQTTQQGEYVLEAGTNVITFCVNLLDAAESNIQPRDELPFGRYGKVAATTLKRANMELWRWLAAAGLLVLLFEWWYYHRRTA